ncbi:hypothetical protein L7F22_053544 [Adiantum nelumboides]|nr:hypothetical protein [Adiantum nelumboides]
MAGPSPASFFALCCGGGDKTGRLCAGPPLSSPPLCSSPGTRLMLAMLHGAMASDSSASKLALLAHMGAAAGDGFVRDGVLGSAWARQAWATAAPHGRPPSLQMVLQAALGQGRPGQRLCPMAAPSLRFYSFM